MLHVAAFILKQDQKKQEAATQSVNLALMSRDFAVSVILSPESHVHRAHAIVQAPLKARLTICLLSPNIPAYVTDASVQIMVSALGLIFHHCLLLTMSGHLELHSKSSNLV
jgi:hypothetical protein